MLSFEEFLKLRESPNGHYGDWSGNNEMRYLGKTLADAVLLKRYT